MPSRAVAFSSAAAARSPLAVPCPGLLVCIRRAAQRARARARRPVPRAALGASTPRDDARAARRGRPEGGAGRSKRRRAADGEFEEEEEEQGEKEEQEEAGEAGEARGVGEAGEAGKAGKAAQVEHGEVKGLAGLAVPELLVDPVKSVPAALVEASGAMQFDDGSFGVSPLVAVPRPMVKRGEVGKKGFNFARVRRQLAEGFDGGLGGALVLLGLFAVWYTANTVFNVYNKQVLKAFPYPLTCTVVQFAVAGLFMGTLWAVGAKKPPRMNGFLVRLAAPLAVLHAAGFLLTNMSLGKVSVAFTHTVKSTEPFFSVALTPSILGDVPTWGILGSLFPIVAGVALASANEVSFNWVGFLSAIGSNVALQSRNVLSKKLMETGSGRRKARDRKGRAVEVSREEEETLSSLDNVNLFATMSILAFALLVPICVFWEGVPLVGAAVAADVTGMQAGQLFRMLTVAGACRCVDVLSSYMILQRVSPVTHSVGNCVKRAVVIGVSIVFFQTRMNGLNIAGTVLALMGVLLYSVVVSACKQNTFGPDSPFCKPIYEAELELTEGSGI